MIHHEVITDRIVMTFLQRSMGAQIVFMIIFNEPPLTLDDMYVTTSMLEAFATILTDNLLIINFHCHDQTPV